MKKYILWPDTHVPYEDKKAVNLALRVADAFEPDGIVLKGDFQDAYPISDFPKKKRARIEDEIYAGRKLLDRIEAIGAKTHDFEEGNHEARLPTYIAKNCPELSGIIPSLATLLGLHPKWTWHPYRSVMRLGKLHLSHDFGASGPTAHIKAMNDVWGNAAHGHTHHFGIQYKGSLSGKSHFGAALGCLADKNQVEYMNRAKCAHWVQGLGLGYLLPNGNFHLTLCPFVNGVAIVEGKVVR